MSEKKKVESIHLYGVWMTGKYWSGWWRDGDGVIFHTPYLPVALAQCKMVMSDTGPARVCTFLENGDPDPKDLAQEVGE